MCTGWTGSWMVCRCFSFLLATFETAQRWPTLSPMEDLANQTLTTDDKKLFEPSFHDPIPFCCNSIAGGYIRFGMSHNLPFYAARGVSEKRMYGASAMFPQGGNTTGNAKEIFRGASRSLKTTYASICPQVWSNWRRTKWMVPPPAYKTIQHWFERPPSSFLCVFVHLAIH